jgi:hypothetical protein
VPLTPGTISGTSSICANQAGVSYSIASVAGASTYNWTVPTGATIASGQGTTSITVNFGTSGGSVRVRAGNACGNSSYRTLTVSVTCREANLQSENIFDAQILPNPSSTFFTLRFNRDYDSKIVLIVRDLAGREVEKYQNLHSGDNFNFGNELPAGVYMVELIAGDERKIQRVIKQE